jgi:ABC-type sugar transport system ATPase subunit
VTILYISHRIPEVLALSDRITILRDGKKRETLINRDISEDALIALMVGRNLTELHHRDVLGYRGDNTKIFEVEAIRASSTSSELSLAVRRGEILGIFGLEGSGTFELAERLAGLRPHSSGMIRIGQRTFQRWSPRDLADCGVPFLHSNRKEAGLFLNLDVTENVAAPRLRQLSRWGLMQQAALVSAVANAIQRFGIKAQPRGQPVRNLSGGNQQKLMLSLALDRRPTCFIVSEPTRGVDVGSKFAIHRLMRTVAADGGGILLFTSELPELLTLAHAAVVMRDGRIVRRFEGDEMTEEGIMVSAAGTTTHA